MIFIVQGSTGTVLLLRLYEKKAHKKRPRASLKFILVSSFPHKGAVTEYQLIDLRLFSTSTIGLYCHTNKNISRWLLKLITKKKVLFLGFSMIILLITIMVFTTPTKKEIQQWTLNENEIVCQKVDWGLKCMKDDREIRFSSSHFKNVAIFASYEVDYEYESGEQVTYRTLGILGKVFSMEDKIFMSIVVGIIMMCAVYLILSKSLLRIIIGTGLLSHGVHLLLITMGGLPKGEEAPPLLGEHSAKGYIDPLPQALILTAIVISFGVTAFFLVLAYRAYQELGTDDMERMIESEDHWE